jgi:hypothetical protein
MSLARLFKTGEMFGMVGVAWRRLNRDVIQPSLTRRADFQVFSPALKRLAKFMATLRVENSQPHISRLAPAVFLLLRTQHFAGGLAPHLIKN